MKNLIPDYEYNSVLDIDPSVFKGKKLLIFDIDNTLFYPETTKINPQIQEWIRNLQKKQKCICISNSLTIRERASKIKNITNCSLLITKYRKPSKKLFQIVLNKYQVKAEDIMVIGDMRFTDIAFAKKNNASAILVKPMSNKELFSIKIARFLERLAMMFHKKQEGK